MNEATRKRLREYMNYLCQTRDPFITDATNFSQISPTHLAETAASDLDDEFDCQSMLDDDVHEIWDIAFELAEKYNKNAKSA